MRIYIVPAIFGGFVGALGVTAAIAADFSGGGEAVSTAYSAYSARIEPIVIYDDQPGVIGRSYWYAPWANRHYFPKTGKRPRLGRLEHITARPPSRAEPYFRFWSASSGTPFVLPPTRASRYGIAPVQPTE